jgi:hypothetical protein
MSTLSAISILQYTTIQNLFWEHQLHQRCTPFFLLVLGLDFERVGNWPLDAMDRALGGVDMRKNVYNVAGQKKVLMGMQGVQESPFDAAKV